MGVPARSLGPWKAQARRGIPVTQAVLPKQPAFNVVAVKIIQNDTELKLCMQGPEGCWPLVRGSDTLPGTGKGVVATPCRSSTDVPGSLRIKLTRIPQSDRGVRLPGRAECVH